MKTPGFRLIPLAAALLGASAGLLIASCSGSPPAVQGQPGAAAACGTAYPCGNDCKNPPSKSCFAAPPCGSSEPCLPPDACNGGCDNDPYVPTLCETTQYGPARANVVFGESAISSTNMLYCKSGSYALCFFSGPPTATGDDPNNKPLPCVVDGDVAHCTCKAFTGSYFVDVNGIGSLGVYYETVKACGHDGSKCANIQACGEDGSKCTVCDPANPVQGCLPEAPACKYISAQQPENPSIAYKPGADLISTFGFALSVPESPGSKKTAPYQLGSQDCTANGGGQYAGCMTAPCYFEKGHTPRSSYDGVPIRCDCPLYYGPFQVGQPDQCCAIASGPEDKASYVWSAAYTVSK